MRQKVVRARELRRDMTPQERAVWSRVRGSAMGAVFRRQVPLDPYVVDFACLSHRLVVEIDGGQHAHNDHDRVRDDWLEDQGFHVLRFWNSDVNTNLDGVLETIRTALVLPE